MIFDSLKQRWDARQERKMREEQLLTAIKNGNSDAAIDTIKQHGKVIGMENIENALGHLAKSTATIEQMDKIIKAAIHVGADINSQLSDWALPRPCSKGLSYCECNWVRCPTLMTLAASKGNGNFIRALYMNGADPLKSAPTGETPIKEARYRKQSDTIELLTYLELGLAPPAETAEKSANAWASIVEGIGSSNIHLSSAKPESEKISPIPPRKPDYKLLKKVIEL